MIKKKNIGNSKKVQALNQKYEIKQMSSLIKLRFSGNYQKWKQRKIEK